MFYCGTPLASNLLSTNMMQICTNWGINLRKGGKCRFCISFTPGCEKACKFGIYYLCSDLFPSLHKFASYLRWANLKQIHFFVQWVTVLQQTVQGSEPSPKHIFNLTNVGQSATNQRQSQGGKTECARDLAGRVSPNGDAAKYFRPLRS